MGNLGWRGRGRGGCGKIKGDSVGREEICDSSHRVNFDIEMDAKAIWDHAKRFLPVDTVLAKCISLLLQLIVML